MSAGGPAEGVELRRWAHGTSGSDDSSFNARAAADPLLRGVCVHAADAEWAGAATSSDDSDSDDGGWANRRRRQQQQRQPRAPASGTSSSLAASRTAGGANRNDVNVVEVSMEWAGGAGFDDSSDASSDAGANKHEARRAQIHRALHRGESSSAPSGEASTLPGAATLPPLLGGRRGSVDQGASLAVRAPRFDGAARGRAASAAATTTRRAARSSVGRTQDVVSNAASALNIGIIPKCNCNRMSVIAMTRFLGCSVLHMCDCGLRLCCLFIYWYHRLYAVFFSLLPWQVMGIMVATFITFHDSDVVLWMHRVRRRYPSLGFPALVLICVVFGFFQAIQLKRAWARQIQKAEILTDMDENSAEVALGSEGTNSGSSATGTAKMQAVFGMAERVMPVALITGVPFLLMNWLWDAQEGFENDCDWEPGIGGWVPIILNCANVILALTVSFGIIEIDITVSLYVLHRYHMDPSIHGSRLGRFQWLYPIAHALFRCTEVLHRVLVITGTMVFVSAVMGSRAAMIVFGLDYAAGLAILYNDAPAKEHASVHLIASLAMMVADLAYFVDLQGFAAPARRISFSLLCWRFGALFTYTAFYFIASTDDVLWQKIHDGGCKQWNMDVACRITLALALLHYTMRFSRMFRSLGDDMHTAAGAGRVDRLKRLLKLSENDQVLDVNDATKDKRLMTPLMFAAMAGNAKVISQLLAAGADVGATSATGDTSLHFAAIGFHVEAVRVLLQHGADPATRNMKGEAAVDVVPGQTWIRTGATVSKELERAELLGALQAPRFSQSFDAENGAAAKATKYYCVRAAPARGVQLRCLFPDVGEDDAPPPRVLHSVSALFVQRAMGPLAHRALSCLDRYSGERQEIPLGALRKVGELGRGGFGRVIEVECPGEPSGTLWRSAARPRRFALKLQLKRDSRQAYSEVRALRRLEHPFIVRLERAFQTPKFFALLLELCISDLNRELCRGREEDGSCLGLESKTVAKYMGQVLLALTHLHMMRIVYRDMKPENVLISAEGDAKLTDFGLAKVVTIASPKRMTMCGTIGFLPPELTAAPATEEAFPTRIGSGDVPGPDPDTTDPFKMDAYSFGVTLQVSLLGEDGARKRTVRKKGPMMLPLTLTESENTELLQQLMQSGRISEAAFELLEGLLRFDQLSRTPLRDVMYHRFFLTELGCEDLQDYLLHASGSV